MYMHVMSQSTLFIVGFQYYISFICKAHCLQHRIEHLQV